MEPQIMLRKTLLVIGSTFIALGIAAAWYTHETREVKEYQTQSGTIVSDHEVRLLYALLAAGFFTSGVSAVGIAVVIPDAAENPSVKENFRTGVGSPPDLVR